MKNSIFVKFIAFVLCAASLVGVAAGGIGAIGVEVYDLNNTTPQEEAETQLESQAFQLAIHYSSDYARKAYTNLTEEEYSLLFGYEESYYYLSCLKALEIRDEAGTLVHSINEPEAGATGRTFTLSAEYPVVLDKTVTPITTEPLNMPGIVTVSTLNIRLNPNADSDKVGQLYSGQEVWIYERIANAPWGRIDEGWINLNYVELDEEALMPTEEHPREALVTHELLTVYDYPSTDSEIVAMLGFNAQVWVYETQSIDRVLWGRIDEGWIQLDYIKYVEEDTPAEPTEMPTYEEPQDEPPVLPTDDAPQDESTVMPTDEAPQDEPTATSLAPDLGEPLYYSEWNHSDGANETVYQLGYYQSPELEVTVYLNESYILSDMQIVNELYIWRDHFIPVLLMGLVLFAMTFVYLCATAGRTTDGTIRPSGLNRVPLDVYLLGAGSLAVACGAGIVFVIDRGDFDTDFFRTCLGLGALGIALAVVGFCFCFAAQVKARGRYWWHHSVTGWCVDKLLLLLAKGLLALRAVGRGIRALFRMLPIVWQWLAVTGGFTFLAVFFFMLAVMGSGLEQLLCLTLFAFSVLGFIASICYGAYAYGILMKGVQYMAQGDLNHKVPTQHLYGTFRDFAEKLNSLGSAASLAAQRQMKSERMKTELITNVSHDIKTPLTSIINFVDLLKKPHTETEGADYLEVLDRQSQRLKKLIDDLMEMSKASTGNLAVELEQVDAVEAVNQALGEFADKLAAVRLTPLFRHPEPPVTLLADGRLVWRVLSNVLSNAVKYALPDTRLYIDLNVLQGNAVIAIKNISREQLNVDAEELMERFVRGDSSRNTEGSGLGLNIAKSLVELQGGQMHLMVDGDLFKVTLIFPLG